MTFLEGLGITWSPNMIDLSGIENLQGLSYLKIEGCKRLRDISHLFKLRNLKKLVLKEMVLNAKALAV
jgi:hypothetical protein